jgi:hypothetical protein
VTVGLQPTKNSKESRPILATEIMSEISRK